VVTLVSTTALPMLCCCYCYCYTQCLISEEVEAKKESLLKITHDIADMVVARAEAGKNYGVVMLPEGLIEFIPEFNHLIAEINDVLARGVAPTEATMLHELSTVNKAVFSFLPRAIKLQLLLDRDPHGNVQVSFGAAVSTLCSCM
jgi:diphosphate-dependent phosphofructokinase